MTLAIILGFSSFFISLLGTRLMIMALRRRAIFLDRPNLRSNHKTPTPRGGGIAVVMAMVICMLIADIHYAIVLAMFLLASVSLLDDLIKLPPWVRLLVQMLAVGVSLSVIHIPHSSFLPVWLDKLLIGLLWIWFTNLFNFMDGIDGISATEMIAIGTGLCFVAAMAGAFPNPLFYYSLIAATAGFGFLWWNWHPAKIFLGDVGSIPIGFILGYLLLLAAKAGYSYAALILPAYYLADSTITLLKRLWQGKKIWHPHSSHYYQMAVRAGRRHSSVVRYIFGVNLLLVFLATMAELNRDLAIFNAGLAYMAVFMLLGFFAHTPADPHNEHL